MTKPHWMSQEDWEDQLEEMKAHAKRIYRQSGGRLELDRSPDYQEPSKH